MHYNFEKRESENSTMYLECRSRRADVRSTAVAAETTYMSFRLVRKLRARRFKVQWYSRGCRIVQWAFKGSFVCSLSFVPYTSWSVTRWNSANYDGRLDFKPITARYIAVAGKFWNIPIQKFWFRWRNKMAGQFLGSFFWRTFSYFSIIEVKSKRTTGCVRVGAWLLRAPRVNLKCLSRTSQLGLPSLCGGRVSQTCVEVVTYRLSHCLATEILCTDQKHIQLNIMKPRGNTMRGASNMINADS